MGKGFISGAGVLLLMAGLSGCAQLQQMLNLEPSRDDALEEVDSLLGRIERVYVECERSEARVAEATARLHKLVAGGSDLDALQAFDSFKESIEASEKQAALLSKSVEPLERSAQAFFDNWDKDLAGFQSAQMRERSHTRMLATRDRYKAIISAVGPAIPMYESFNASLADQALYLQNDFNANSVKELEGEVRTATEVAKALTKKLQDCREAARVYVESAALRGQLSAPQSKPAAAPQPAEPNESAEESSAPSKPAGEQG